MKQRTKNNGSNNDNCETPDWLLEDIRKEFGDFFDPCPIDWDGSYDGTKTEWASVNFINPPYSYPLKDKFIEKAWEESQKGKTCVLLIPASVDTKTFHKYIWDSTKHTTRKGVEMRIFNGRIKFKGYNSKGEYVTDKSGQTGSLLVIFKGDDSYGKDKDN